MNNPTLSIRHLPLDRDEPCSLMCGGCYSKWSHGVTVTCRTSITL